MIEHVCTHCNKATGHKETLVRKPSSYDNKPGLQGKAMLFIHEFINGGHYYNMNRYLTCSVCGHKELANEGDEFE